MNNILQRLLKRQGILLAATLAFGPWHCYAGIVNGDFSNPKVPAKSLGNFFEKGKVPGWVTTDSHFEIWSGGSSHGGVTFNMPAGLTQFAEINAHQGGTLSQTVSDIKLNHKFGFSFYHRGRGSATVPDVLNVTVVDTVTKAKLMDKNFSTTNAKWERYTVDLGVKKDSHPLVLSFKAVSSAVNDISIGNFLTGIELGEEFMAPPGNIKTSSHGDVHISSPDRLYFDYHGIGDFYGARSSDGTFDLVARQQPLPKNQNVTVNTAVALRFAKANTTVTFHALPTARLFVNGKPASLPTAATTLPSGITLSLNARNDYLVEYEGRLVRVVVRGGDAIDYGMIAQSGFKYRGGLIGNMDGNANNDMILPNGAVTAVPATTTTLAQFGEAWRVPANEQFFSEPHPNAPKPAEEVQGVDSATVEAARQKCRTAGIDDPLALKDCTFDVSRTDRPAFIESAKQFQADVKDVPKNERKGGDAATAQTIARGVDVQPAPSAPSSTLFLAGEELRRGSSYTMNGHYITFQPDGNLCVYTSAKQFVWCINNDPNVRYQDARKVVFTKQGTLSVYNANNQPIWQQPASGANPSSKVHITKEGALQIVGPTGSALWSSK